MKYPRPLSQEMSRTRADAAAAAPKLIDAFFALGLDVDLAHVYDVEEQFALTRVDLGRYVAVCGAGRFFKQKEYTTPRFPAKAQ